MTQKIVFYDYTNSVPEQYRPVPAVENLPDWYLKTQSYIDGEKTPNLLANPNDRTAGTIRRCVPVLDALSAGYLLKLHVDIRVRWTGSHHYLEWPDGEPIAWHPTKQNPLYPGQENRSQDYPKFRNPWSIRTPKGYSTLFLSPLHRGLPFHTLEGVVDTDSYFAPVQLPFIFLEPEWDGLLEAGTPICQVVPFRRESWKMEVDYSLETSKSVERQGGLVRSVFNNAYRKNFWSRKEYR